MGMCIVARNYERACSLRCEDCELLPETEVLQGETFNETAVLLLIEKVVQL